MEGEENWEYTPTSGWVFREGEEVSEDSGSPERAQNAQGTAVLQGETAGASEPPTGGADSAHPSREGQGALSHGGERNDGRDQNCGNARGAQQVVSGAAVDSRASAPGGVDPSAEVAEAVDEAGVLSPATSKVQRLVSAPARIQRQHCWRCLIEALWASGIVASYPHPDVGKFIPCGTRLLGRCATFFTAVGRCATFCTAAEDTNSSRLRAGGSEKGERPS